MLAPVNVTMSPWMRWITGKPSGMQRRLWNTDKEVPDVKKKNFRKKLDNMTTSFNALKLDGWTEQRSRGRHECGFSRMVSVVKSVHLIISFNWIRRVKKTRQRQRSTQASFPSEVFKSTFACVSNTGSHLFTMKLSVPLLIQRSQSIISSDYLQIWTVKCFNQQLVFRRASNWLPLETDAQKSGLGFFN